MLSDSSDSKALDVREYILHKKTDPQIHKSPMMDPFLHTRVTQILQFHSRLNPPLVQSTSHPVRGTPMIKSIIC